MGIYKKKPNGDSEEITSIYKKNPKTGEVAEVTSIYKDGKLIYSVTRPLWEDTPSQYIVSDPQLSNDKSLLTYNYNVDSNGVGFVSGIDTIDATTGEPQMFVPNLGNIIGNRYMTDDKTTIYAIDNNRKLLKAVGSTLTSTLAETTALPLDNVYLTGWKELFNNTSGTTVPVNNSPLLYSFQKTNGTTEIGVANLDRFSNGGAFPSLSSYSGTLGNLLFVPVDKFKIFKDEKDYGKYGSAFGDILALVEANDNYSSNKVNWGTLLRISKATYGVSSNLIPVDATLGVSFNSTSTDIPKNTGYINSGMIAPLGYYEDPSNSNVKHVEMVGPYQAWPNPFSEKMYDVRDNNIIIIDGLFDSTNNLWALGNLVSLLDETIPSTNPNSNVTHIKQEIGKVNAIAEDVDNYDKELKVGTSLATNPEYEQVSYSSNSQTKVNTYSYYKPTSGNIYASIQDGEINHVKKFSVNGSNSNYWGQDKVTIGDFKLNGDIDTSQDNIISDFILVTGRSTTLRIDLKTSKSYSSKVGYALYDSNSNIIGVPEYADLENLSDYPGSIIGYRKDVSLPKNCAKVRVAIIPQNDTTVYPVVTFDGNTIYDTEKGYSVNSMTKSGHQLTMTINNNDNGWGKTITGGSKYTLASTLDTDGNIYSVRTDGSTPFYYFSGYNSRDGNYNAVSQSYVPGTTSNPPTTLPWNNKIVWDSYHKRAVFAKEYYNYLFMQSPYTTGTTLPNITITGYYFNYVNAKYNLTPGFLINGSGYIIMPNAYYLSNTNGTNATTPISSATTTTNTNSLACYNYENNTVIWSNTLTNFNGSIQGILYNPIYKGDVVWDANGRLAMIREIDGKTLFQTDPIFPIHDNNVSVTPMYPQNCCILPNGNIISVKVDYSISASATVYIYLINGSTGEVISSKNISVIDNSTTTPKENRVLIANNRDTIVITTNNTSIKVTISDDNTLETSTWSNLIPASYNGTSSDINVKVTSLSSNDTAIFAGTNNGMVFRYDLSSFGFSWVSRGFTNLTSNTIVTAYNNFVYATGTSDSANVGTYKILMNGNLYESKIKAMKV